jgi:hypothetical protein
VAGWLNVIKELKRTNQRVRSEKVRQMIGLESIPVDVLFGQTRHATYDRQGSVRVSHHQNVTTVLVANHEPYLHYQEANSIALRRSLSLTTNDSDGGPDDGEIIAMMPVYAWPIHEKNFLQKTRNIC